MMGGWPNLRTGELPPLGAPSFRSRRSPRAALDAALALSMRGKAPPDPAEYEALAADSVDYPPHYTSHPARCGCGAGIECIQITEHMGFNLGNVVKYVWRSDLKGDALEDLRKARWYLDREIAKRERAAP